MSAERSRFAAVLFLAFPAVATGYALTGAHWNWQDHAFEDPIRLDTGEWPAAYGPASDIEDRITDAMDAWNDAGLDLHLDYGGQISDGDLAIDGYWDITYVSGSGSTYGPALAFAGTWMWDDSAGNDCDIVFLDENQYGSIAWSSDASGPSSGTYGIEEVALHELGHCIGLDHASARSSVMYATYQGLDELAQDDIDGANAVHGATACVDGDGDGYSDCDLDCDDSNAALNPGAGEVCDGIDGNCDGVIDQYDELELSFLSGGTAPLRDHWYAAGNAFVADHATMLVRVEQAAEMDAGMRLVWTVYGSSDGGSTWDLVRSERAVATSGTHQTSPDLFIPLIAGDAYIVQLGGMGEDLEMRYGSAGSLSSVGPLTPLGMAYGRAIGDASVVDSDYVLSQTLTVADEADPDGDGQTALCGDCAPDDALKYDGATELCNGEDDDCDGEIDEDFDIDSDGDGTIDCMDPCPDDPLDDRDGDGVCDGDDPCPDDWQDDRDGDGACDSDDPCPDDATDDSDGDGSCDSEDPCPDDPTDTCDDPEPEDTGEGVGLGEPDVDDSEDESSGTPYDPTADDGKGTCGAVSGSASSLAVVLGLLAVVRRREN